MQSTIHRGMKVISQDQVMMLRMKHIYVSNRYKYNLIKISLVKFESEKHELKDVDSTEQLQLKCSVMSHTPHTDGNTENADNHQGDENQDPLKYDWSIVVMKASDWSPCVSWCPGYPRSGART